MVDVIKFFTRSPWSAKLGLAIITLNIFCALFAPALAPYSETEIAGDVWEPPIWSEDAIPHDTPVILGTDHIGRDLFLSLIHI